LLGLNNVSASRAKNLGSREGGAEGGFKGGFRAARAVRFRQGSLGSGFALFPKLTTRQKIAKALNISLEDLII